MLHWLTRCPVTDLELARRWKLLKIFLLAAIGISFLNAIAEGQWSIRTVYSLLTIASLFIAYLLNQCSHIRIAAWIFLLSATLPTAMGIIHVIHKPGANPYFGLYYLMTGIALSGVFFSWRSVLGISAVLSLFTFSLALFGIEWLGGAPWRSMKDPINYLVSLILIFIVVTLLAMYSSWSLERSNTEIQERRATEKVAEEAQRAAEAASKAKSLFLANMSHELRTPLTTILGYTEMLLEEATLEGRTRLASDLGRIETSGKHLLSMISDILDLAKIEAGKMDIFVETFALSNFLSDADLGCTARPLMDKNNNLLVIELGEGLDTMSSDLTKLRQVLLNLLSNAAKFTEKGTVTLRAELHPEKPGWIRFLVRDTGEGMTPEQMERLFQPFTQGDSSTTKRYGGTGLGLALCRNVCELLGGQIQAESTPSQGSCFTVSLPLSIPQRPSANSNPEDSMSSASNRVSAPPVSLRQPPRN